MLRFAHTVVLTASFAGLPACGQHPVPPGQPTQRASAPANQTDLRSPLVPFPSGGETPLGARIATLLSDSRVASAHWGVAVTMMDGTPIYGLDESKLFRPASTAKLFTTAAAMALLGPGARVQTRLTYTGKIGEDGTLDGYLTLRGAGDANFAGATPTSPGGDPLAVLDDFAAEVAARGIRRVTQLNIAGWLWDPYPEGWGVDDRLFGFGAPVTGLVLNDNTMTLNVEPAPMPGSAAKISLNPHVSKEGVLGTVATVPTGTVFTGLTLHDWPGDLNLLLVGGTVAPGQPVHGTVAVLDPAVFAESAFIDRLATHGVEAAFQAPQRAISSDTRSFSAIVHEPVSLPGAPTAAGSELSSPVAPAAVPACSDQCTLLATHTSGTLADDVALTLKLSKNLHAEVMLRRLGGTFGNEYTFAQGERVLRQFLMNAGMDPAGITLYDGSGLSARDLVTPRTEAQLLGYAAKQPWFTTWKAALPVGGVDGTLESRFTEPPLKGHVFAKTGTLGETSVLAGYVQCASGREVIFSVMVDNHEPGDSEYRKVMDQIVGAIAALD